MRGGARSIPRHCLALRWGLCNASGAIAGPAGASRLRGRLASSPSAAWHCEGPHELRLARLTAVGGMAAGAAPRERAEQQERNAGHS